MSTSLKHMQYVVIAATAGLVGVAVTITAMVNDEPPRHPQAVQETTEGVPALPIILGSLTSPEPPASHATTWQQLMVP